MEIAFDTLDIKEAAALQDRFMHMKILNLKGI